jgi:vacuolar-type H+-ATPase subunit E/Vma4
MDGEQSKRPRRKELVHRTRYFENARRIENERINKLESDPEYKKRFILKCASGGFGRNGKPKITLAKMSWDT